MLESRLLLRIVMAALGMVGIAGFVVYGFDYQGSVPQKSEADLGDRIVKTVPRNTGFVTPAVVAPPQNARVRIAQAPHENPRPIASEPTAPMQSSEGMTRPAGSQA